MEKLKEGMLIPAKKLREKEILKQIPNKPGYYKWWAPKKLTKKFLDFNPSYTYFEQLEDVLERHPKQENLYYIYVGIAVKESVRDRLNWHINQKHSKSSVKSGFLSTFRQTISSLCFDNHKEEEKTNQVIDELFVEYHVVEDKDTLEKIELEELNQRGYFRPLNIKGNQNIEGSLYKKELQKRRKEAYEKAMKDWKEI